MRNKIILITTLLWAFVGAVQVQAQNSVNFFFAVGGAKTITGTIQFTGVKDSIYTVTSYYSYGPNGTLWAMKSRQLKATGLLQTFTDTITDSNSANSLPVSDSICVVARLQSPGFVDTLSNKICGISVTETPKKPKISAVSKPNVTPNGSGYWVNKVETNVLAVVYTYVSLDSIGTYNPLNKLTDSILIMGNPNFPNITVSLGICPPFKSMWARSVIVNAAGKDSIAPTKTDVYFPPVPATCELDSVAPYSNKFGIRVKTVGAGLPTDGGIEAQKAGTTTWYSVSDTFHVSGQGVQPSWVNTYPIFDPETAYFIRSWVYNGLGTKSYSYVSAQPYYTSKVNNLGYFAIKINKVVEDTHGGIDVTLTTNTTNNTVANAYIKISENRNFTPSIIKGPYVITTSSDTRTVHIALSTSGTFHFTGYGMDNKGVQIDSSNVLTITVHNWSVGMDINKDFAILQSESGVQYQLIDVTGKVVADGFTENAFEQINLIDLPTGMYSCILTKDGYRQIGKIIK